MLWNLKQRSFETDSVIISHIPLVLRHREFWSCYARTFSRRVEVPGLYRKGPIELRHKTAWA